ncbi:MAG TPA: GntR family transcriptional regulator [Streptosporangiaceae bacterium]
MSAGVSAAMVARLTRDRVLLAQIGTAERVATLLRDNIADGVFPPGTRLSEEAIGQALGVSRNTLREAFRLLCHERLAVHELNRGIFVPVLTGEDVVDLYRLRRLVEGGAARLAGQASDQARDAVVAAVAEGEAASGAGDWQAFRSADLHFHQAVAALAGSPRVDELMRRALAELRLVFHVMKDPEEFHRPFVAKNRVIGQLIADGDGPAAERELLAYLADAERTLLAAYRAAG